MARSFNGVPSIFDTLNRLVDVRAIGCLDPAVLGQRYSDFPMERVEYERYEPACIVKPRKDLESLAGQLALLPEDVQKTITLRRFKRSIRIGMLVNGFSRAVISVAQDPPHAVHRVRVRLHSRNRPLDITSRLLGPIVDESINKIFAKLSSACSESESPDSLLPRPQEPLDVAMPISATDVAEVARSTDAAGEPAWSSFGGGPHRADSTSVSPDFVNAAGEHEDDHHV